MSKTLILLAVAVIAIGIGAGAIYSEEETPKNEGKTEGAKCHRYSAELNGLTTDNEKEVQKALEGIENVISVKVYCNCAKCFLVSKAGTELSQDAVRKALENLNGVSLKSFVEITAPSAANPQDNKAKGAGKRPENFKPGLSPKDKK